MDESITAENKEQNRQKPPRSLGRITGEILAGTATGFAAAGVVYVTGVVLVGGRDHTGSVGQLALLGFLATFVSVVPPFYGLGSAVGVYLVGNMGEQTGSFLPTLGWGFLGGIVMFPMILGAIILSSVLVVGAEVIVAWLFCALVLLTPPIFATLGFNWTRRDK